MPTLTPPMPPLRPNAPSIAEFAQDLAECGEPISARDLCEAYLDNALSPDWDGDFDALVAQQARSFEYYI